MDYDTAEYFNTQAAALAAKNQVINAKACANGSFARKQWMTSACEALRGGAQFSERQTRRIAQPWDGRMSALSLNRA